MMSDEEIIRIAAEIGAKSAMDKLEDERKKMRTENVKIRQHNIKLLMRNYRSLKASVLNAVYEAECSETAMDILEDLMQPGRNPNLTIESVKRSAARTAVLMEHVDAELHAFKYKCEHSRNPKIARQWEAVFWMHISEAPKTAEEIASMLNCEVRTIYYDLNNAYETLSALMFGVDGLKSGGKK